VNVPIAENVITLVGVVTTETCH